MKHVREWQREGIIVSFSLTMDNATYNVGKDGYFFELSKKVFPFVSFYDVDSF